MDQGLKQRLVGAAVLVALLVIFVPMILRGPQKGLEETNVPPEPEVGAVTTEPAAPAPVPGTTAPPAPEPRPDNPPAQEQAETGVSPDAETAPADAEPEQSEASAQGSPAADTGSDGSGEEASAGPDVSDNGGWVVQVGSFRAQDNAIRLRDRLKRAGYSAFIEPTEQAAGRLYRVRVGPEVDRARAQTLKEAVEKDVDLTADAIVLEQ